MNDDDLLDHYDIDFSKAKPNRFAALFGPLKPGGRVVYLDPEIAERFATSEDVNRVLKMLVEVMQPPTTVGDLIGDVSNPVLSPEDRLPEKPRPIETHAAKQPGKQKKPAKA